MADTTYDVVVVGAGPTGLAAALYTAREDLKTLVLDKGIVGGLIATTDIVENYPGFPEGIAGADLSDLMQRQTERFGAKIETGVEVTGLEPGKKGVVVKTPDSDYLARSVLIATGSQYRHLEVPGESELEGKGVHYCATCDGPLYRDKALIAVGGGNSALQESLFLAKFASKVTLLVRGPEFRGTEVLAEKVKSNPKIEIKFNTSVAEIVQADGKFKGVKTGDGHLEADGLFVFAGLIPNSEWLKGAVNLDERGFVKVDSAFCTNLPGVFAAGDIVEGSVGQIAAAIGEGVTAALSIREHLDSGHPLAG